MVGNFKQTEIGAIPNDWDVKNIIEFSTMKARIGWQGLTVSEYLDRGDYFLITGTDLVDGRIKWDTCHFVNKDRFIQDKNIQIKAGDILITKDGTIGKVAYVDSLTMPATLNSGVFVIRPKKEAYLPIFLFYIFNSFYFRDFLNKLVAGSTISHLYQKDFITFNFPLPKTVAEQTAIATALNDVDALITQLEKLIAKKKEMKQGAMQELLKPKEGWETKTLGEIIKLQGGYAFKSDFFIEVGVPIIRISDVNNDRISIENSVCYEQFNIPQEFVARNGDILIAMSGATTGKIGIYLLDKIAYINQRVGKFVILNPELTSLSFISHVVRSGKFKEGLSKLLAQGAQPNISGKQIESVLFPFPPTKTEQDQIAQILSDMNFEIEKLETKLEKQKQLKQGMMQSLLTGKIRLV